MTFTDPLPPEDKSIDDPRIMQIGGPRNQRIWSIVRWAMVIAVIGALMVILFIRFGATTLWAFGVVGFMIGYMAIMAWWAGRN